MQRREFCKKVGVSLIGGITHPLFADSTDTSGPNQPSMQSKIDNYNLDFSDDFFLEKIKFASLKSVVARLDKIQANIGYGRFNLIGFDDVIKVGRDTPSIGAFSESELNFIDEIFNTDAKIYGFFGEKVLPSLTANLNGKETLKVEGSGHYLFQGKPLSLFQKIRKDVGPNVILTSGIRNIVKQTHLFLTKSIQTNANLSRASRSLAPPGHSFHGISDFDVGMVGWGKRNFTNEFADSDVFKKLVDLGYAEIRYHKTNTDGVRFEPWHIKVA